MVRKATNADLSAIAAIYSAVHTEEECGRMTIGWNRKIYPTQQTAQDAIARGDMYVLEDGGSIVAAGLLNQLQVAEYALVDWEIRAEDEAVFVLHTLVVDPQKARRGYAAQFVAYYNDLAYALGCRTLRIDTNERNTAARRLYAKLGFRESGIIPCVFNGLEGVQLVCLERAVLAPEEERK